VPLSAPQYDLAPGLSAGGTPKPARRRLDTTQRNCYKASDSGVGALVEPRPSWATAGRPLGADLPAKREKGTPLTAAERVRGKRVQLLRSRIVANALAQLPDPLVFREKYEATMRCGATVTRANFNAARGASVDFGRLCRNRWCEFCSAARLGEWRKQFQPILSEWGSLHHLVVTVPTMRHLTEGRGGRRLNRLTAVKLRLRVQEMLRATREIANDVRRTARLPWKAIRHVETTYTWERDGDVLDWYHPHIHFIVESEAAAREFLRRWLLRFPDCSPRGQFCEPVTLAKAMREVFKYVTKAVKTERAELRDSGGRIVRDARSGKPIWTVRYVGMRADCLDVIYAALRGVRLHQAMGFKAPKLEDDGEVSHGVDEDGSLPPALPDFECDRSTWRWSDAALDWLSEASAGLDRATGEYVGARVPLAGAELPLRYLRMLAAYEVQIFVGVPRLGGVRLNGLVAKCYQMRRADREAARAVVGQLSSGGTDDGMH
jgi:hypothetical protein